MSFYIIMLIIICTHPEIYTKTNIRLRLVDHKHIFTLPSGSAHVMFLKSKYVLNLKWESSQGQLGKVHELQVLW